MFHSLTTALQLFSHILGFVQSSSTIFQYNISPFCFYRYTFSSDAHSLLQVKHLFPRNTFRLHGPQNACLHGITRYVIFPSIQILQVAPVLNINLNAVKALESCSDTSFNLLFARVLCINTSSYRFEISRSSFSSCRKRIICF